MTVALQLDVAWVTSLTEGLAYQDTGNSPTNDDHQFADVGGQNIVSHHQSRRTALNPFAENIIQQMQQIISMCRYMTPERLYKEVDRFYTHL